MSRPLSQPYMRVSDAERAEVADALKRHCADGRLDSSEFEARIDRTLRAKTRADLAGLLDDLPDLTPGRASHPAAASFDRAQRYPVVGDRGLSFPNMVVIGVVVIAVVAIVFGILASMARPHLPWVLVLLAVAFVWARVHHHGHHRA